MTAALGKKEDARCGREHEYLPESDNIASFTVIHNQRYINLDHLILTYQVDFFILKGYL